MHLRQRRIHFGRSTNENYDPGGDTGETSLGDGTRVSKTDPRIGLMGAVDRLNSWIGVIRAHQPDGAVADVLEGVQHDLFDLGGALCFPGAPLLSAGHVQRLDDAVEALNAGLPSLKEFILPGGAPLVAWLHVGRTEARGVERDLAAFTGEPMENRAAALQYLNRLSDVLFIAARVEARRLGSPEVYWEKSKSVSGQS